MTNFILLGDVHIKNKTDVRIDDYQETLLRKLKEVVELANTYNAYLLQGGDLLDSPGINDKYVLQVIRVLKTLKKSFGFLVGNHDAKGYSSWLDTKLGYLKELPNYFVLNDEHIVEGIKIIGVNYGEGIPTEEDCDLLCTHDDFFINNKDVSTNMGVARILNKYPKVAAKVWWNSHVHCGHPVARNKATKTIYVNPGSLMRTTRSDEDITRTVQITLLNIAKGIIKLKYLPINHEPADKVFVKKEEKISEQKSFQAFISKLKDNAAQHKHSHVIHIIQAMIQNKHVPEKIGKAAINRLEQIQSVNN